MNGKEITQGKKCYHTDYIHYHLQLDLPNAIDEHDVNIAETNNQGIDHHEKGNRKVHLYRFTNP